MNEFDDDDFDEDFDEGDYILIELLDSEEGFGFNVPIDEPHADRFMSMLNRIDTMVAERALEGLIRTCELQGRSDLATEIKMFLSSTPNSNNTIH